MIQPLLLNKRRQIPRADPILPQGEGVGRLWRLDLVERDLGNLPLAGRIKLSVTALVPCHEYQAVLSWLKHQWKEKNNTDRTIFQ